MKGIIEYIDKLEKLFCFVIWMLCLIVDLELWVKLFLML